jgi:hypothetical protein
MKRLLHRLAHFFGLYSGTVETWRARCGKPMQGLRCDQCGKLEAIVPDYAEMVRDLRKQS